MRILLLSMMLPFCFSFGHAQIDQTESWANSPSKKRLESIQEYKPVVRRSRTVAIKDLEQQLLAAKSLLSRVEQVLALEKAKARGQKEGAWTLDKLEAAQGDLVDLKALVSSSEAYLAMAKLENDKIEKFMERERKGAKAQVVLSPAQRDSSQEATPSGIPDSVGVQEPDSAAKAPTGKSKDRSRRR